MNPAPQVGQTVFMIEGRRRLDGVYEPEPVAVTKVGKKYFYIERYGRAVPVHLGTWIEKSEFSRARFYTTKEEYFDQQERSRLCAEIRNVIQYGNGFGDLSLEDVREIHKKIIRKE